MEARLLRAVFLAALVASLGAGYRTTNFVIEAPTQELAEKIGRAAETYRKNLALEWLGEEMPNWAQPCPIHADVAPQLGAGGATSFVFDHGEVFGWRMNIQGSEERILDSVLPHEVTHTVFATHFRHPLPRWADEGACTTVEHVSERAKQERMLITFLRTGRGISFSQMFAMTEYPQDILPLYSQGYSLARYLIDQKGKREFLAFVGDGLKTSDWTAAIDQHYGFKSLAVLQDTWLDWVKQGSPLRSPAVDRPADVLAVAPAKGRPAGNVVVRAQSADRADQPARSLAPVRNGSVAMESGPTMIAMTGAPPVPQPIAAAAVSPDQADAATVSTNDAAWRHPSPDAAAQSGSATPGKSVYGDGVGMIVHSSDAATTRTANSPPTADQTFPLEPTRTADNSRHVMLEWQR